MSVEIRIGDCRDLLKAMPDESVHCVVTSPPYWGLRSYLADDHPDKSKEIGLERCLGEHLDVLVDVFREVRRVMRKDAVLWLNYGDCYATSPNGRSAADTKAAAKDDRTFRDKPFSTIGAVYVPEYEKTARHGKGQNNGHLAAQHGGRIVGAGGYLKPKDLCMVANRLAIALQDDGWWVRQEIVWAKPNPMPDSSGRFRPSSSMEKVWFLSKSADHYYDHESVMEPLAAASVARPGQPNISEQLGSDRANAGRKTNGRMKAVKIGGNKKGGTHGSAARLFSGNDWEPETDMRLMRNVWTIPTAAFSEAHFATFPPALVEPCIKAGCPIGGIVLDPFGGSGTVGMVADRLGRNAILMELNTDGLAEKRIRDDAGMFAEVNVQ